MDDIKEDIKKLSIFPMQTEYITKLDIRYKISKYDDYTINYLHNLLEIENKKPFYFLCHLKELIISKGHEYNFIEKSNTEIKHEKGNNELYNNIICSYDISCEEYEKIEHKKKCNDNLTISEKLESMKYYYKYKLSLNNLNIDIIKMYYNKFYLLNNFLCIIDINNYKINDNCENIKNYNKLILIKKFIFDLGIINIFDENWNISEDILIKNFNFAYNNNILFKKESKILYNIPNFINNNYTTKKILGFVNSILNNYSIKISMQNKMKRYGYNLQILHHVDEIVKRKLMYKYQFFDKDNIFTSNKCNLMELY